LEYALRYTLLLFGFGVVHLGHCFDQNQEQHFSTIPLLEALRGVRRQSFCELIVEKQRLAARDRSSCLPSFLDLYS
jgi:hypothetical protein